MRPLGSIQIAALAIAVLVLPVPLGAQEDGLWPADALCLDPAPRSQCRFVVLTETAVLYSTHARTQERRFTQFGGTTTTWSEQQPRVLLEGGVGLLANISDRWAIGGGFASETDTETGGALVKVRVRRWIGGVNSFDFALGTHVDGAASLVAETWLDLGGALALGIRLQTGSADRPAGMFVGGRLGSYGGLIGAAAGAIAFVSQVF